MTQTPEFPEDGQADTDIGLGDTLPPSEATDSDELRDDDGDEVVTAPDRWYPIDEPAFGAEGERQSLDDRLAAEEPEPDELDPALSADRPMTGGHRRQVSGSPEDGDSFFPEE